MLKSPLTSVLKMDRITELKSLERGISIDSNVSTNSDHPWQDVFEKLKQPRDNTIDISELENYIKSSTDDEVNNYSNVSFLIF